MSITCNKCGGTGRINSFSHIANGRCFQCMGNGFMPEPKKKSVTYSRAFINQFYSEGYFYAPENAEFIECISMKGHATAEEWVIKSEDFVLIGQPICHGSMHFKISKDQYPEFAKHYEIANKKPLPIISL